MTDFADWPLLTFISATPMDSRVLPLETWNKMETIPYKARDIHRDQCRNFSFFKDAPILIRQISIPFQLTNFTDRELAKFQSFMQEVSNKNNKQHPFYSNIEPGQRNGLIKQTCIDLSWFVLISSDLSPTRPWLTSLDLLLPKLTYPMVVKSPIKVLHKRNIFNWISATFCYYFLAWL